MAHCACGPFSREDMLLGLRDNLEAGKEYTSAKIIEHIDAFLDSFKRAII